MSPRTCACGRGLRSDNRTGVCWRCQNKRRSATRCAGGCGRVIDSRARFGMCRSCTLSVAHKIAAELTSLAGDTRNPAAVDLHTAAIAFAQRRYSATRHGAFLAALDAYGSTVGSLLTGER